MNSWIVIGVSIGYLAALFLAAHIIDKRIAFGKRLVNNKWIYALALPVYCTAWTFYGSVGKATTDGWEFLTIYIGPILTMPLWWIVVRKIIRICEHQRISTLPDFISARYGKSLSISVISSFIIILGIIPYIAIQLKSITNSFEILTLGAYREYNPSLIFFNDSAFYLTIILAAFIIIFVFRNIETTDKHHGLMGAIAIDSIIKLIAFLAVGVFVTYFLFDGVADLFSQSSESLQKTYQEIPNGDGLNWFLLLLLSMSAIILLPRQFQVAIAENTDENHIKTAGWVFPLYLLLINVFVVPIAMAGKLILPAATDPDSYVLAIPLIEGAQGLALFTFIGGFSAATGMIIVSTTALSMIASNNIYVPLLLKRIENRHIYLQLPLKARRLAVFTILIMAYIYYKFIADRFSIVSIGLVSFAAIIQFVPAVIGALFWRDANKKGVLAGLIAGFIIWGYTLVIPTMVEIGWFSEQLFSEGPWGIFWLNPQALFNANLSPIAQGTFWSLFVNFSLFFSISIFSQQSAKERNVAELFIGIFQKAPGDERLVWKGNLPHEELINISKNVLGKNRTEEAINHFQDKHGIINRTAVGDSKFVNYMERMLAGAIGSASARLLIASIAKEEEIEIKDVIGLLRETSEISALNRELKIKSVELTQRTVELEKANLRLQNLDSEKDDFISTVTHELRTPLTSIKAFVEIIQDNPEIEERDHFLNTINDEIDRMTRLINQVLDMEKLDSGAVTINQEPISFYEILEDSIKSMRQMIESKNIQLVNNSSKSASQIKISGDYDRLKQVLINLLSNSIKYAKEGGGFIQIETESVNGFLRFDIIDNGKGIKSENMDQIFDKFFQARDQTLKKPKGTGLGLSITKKIVELHKGSIEVESRWEEGSTFTIKLPIINSNL